MTPEEYYKKLDAKYEFIRKQPAIDAKALKSIAHLKKEIQDIKSGEVLKQLPLNKLPKLKWGEFIVKRIKLRGKRIRFRKKKK